MFRHLTEDFGGFEKHILRNSQSGNEFSVLPGCGALLTSCKIDGTELIDGYQNEAELIDLEFGKSLLLFPFPNRLDGGKYSFHGKNYQFPINDPGTENAIHGLGFKTPFVIGDIETNQTSAALTCNYSYTGINQAFPFPFKISIRYEMTDNQFNTFLKIENTGSSPMPAGLGWHPYFTIYANIDEVSLQFPELEKIEIDRRMIPTGKRTKFNGFLEPKSINRINLDTCFYIPENCQPFKATLDSPNGKLIYSQETGSGKFNYVQFFTPSHRRSLAIEPMTCNINAFNNGEGLIVLQPGEHLGGSCGFQFTKKIS